MFKYIIKRILLSILILLGVSIIIYFLIRLMPSDFLEKKFASQLAQGTMTLEQLNEMKDHYGLLDNSFVGIIKGYWDWLTKALQGDLGISFVYNKPVASVIGEKMWISFIISGVALIFEFVIAIPLGIFAGSRRGTVADFLAMFFALLGQSFSLIKIHILSIL